MKTIKERKKNLQNREKKLKLQLKSSEDELKVKAKNIGKIALISGLTIFLSYWVFQFFFENNEKAIKPKKKKKYKQINSGVFERLSAFALSYITKFLHNFLEISNPQEEKNKKNELD